VLFAFEALIATFIAVSIVIGRRRRRQLVGRRLLDRVDGGVDLGDCPDAFRTRFSIARPSAI
jgi:hypothetical protein